MNLVATAKDPATNLRVPKQLMDLIDRAAKASGRSRNSEIIVRLGRSFESTGKATAA